MKVKVVRLNTLGKKVDNNVESKNTKRNQNCNSRKSQVKRKINHLVFLNNGRKKTLVLLGYDYDYGKRGISHYKTQGKVQNECLKM